MSLTQQIRIDYGPSKGDATVPAGLIRDVLNPDRALRTGHHIVYLMQLRASLLHRDDERRFHGSRRKKALRA